MFLEPGYAKELFEAGFKLDYIPEGSLFYFKDEKWVIGGRISPGGPTSISPKIKTKGLWLPELEHLLEWLEFRNFELEIKTSRYKTIIIAKDQNKREYHGSSSSMIYALYDIIMQVLKSGQVPEWDTFSVEIID